MAELREITTGLRFPEGPIAMPDGSVVLVEIQARHDPRAPRRDDRGDRRSRRRAERRRHGTRRCVLHLQQRRLFTCHRSRRPHASRSVDPDRYIGGRIQRVDPATGSVTTVHRMRRPSAARARTTSCSTPRAGSGSPTTASVERRAIAPASLRAGPTARRSREVIFPRRAPERHRAVARTATACTSRRRTRAASQWASLSRARSVAVPLDAAAVLLAGVPGCRCSTRSPSTAPATSASRRS